MIGGRWVIDWHDFLFDGNPVAHWLDTNHTKPKTRSGRPKGSKDFAPRERICKTACKNDQGIGETASKTVHPGMCHDLAFCRRNLECYLWILLPKSEGVIL